MKIGVALAVLLILGFVTAFWLHRRRAIARGRSAFHREPLRTLVAAGHVSQTSARIWGRTHSAGQHTLSLHKLDSSVLVSSASFQVSDRETRDGTFSISYPDDFEGARSLEPGTAYSCSIESAQAGPIGECQFETAPSSPGDVPSVFSVAAMSCHQPFDSYGNLIESAASLLDALPEALEKYAVKRVLLMGDQVYGDLPPACALNNRSYFRKVAPRGRRTLLECTREEVRSMYQLRHRIFWKAAGFQRIQTWFPCHPILDDHEIIDNFGSSPEHGTSRYEALRHGALDAFYDYQASRVLPLEGGRRPDSFYSCLEYGTLSVFVMDLRSERKATNGEIQVCSEEQFVELEQFLNASQSKHVVCIVLSVPLLHVPDWLSNVGFKFTSPDGDMEDRWSNPKARKSRDRLLEILREHQKRCPKQRLVLLGGDVHVGVVTRFEWGDGIRDSYQLISSAVSNASTFDLRKVIEGAPKLKPVVGSDGVRFKAEFLTARASSSNPPSNRNPYGGLNCGVVEVERTSDEESTVRLLLLGSSEENPTRCRVVFDSGPL